MFSVVTANGNKITATRQLPDTPAYAFTDYRSQAQTIGDHCIVDLATPPIGKLTPFNA